MPTATEQRVYALLHRMPDEGLAAAKQLFWTELNYDRVNAPLSRRNWPQRTAGVLSGDPHILAHHESQFGTFEIIHAQLTSHPAGRGFPLSLMAERGAYPKSCTSWTCVLCETLAWPEPLPPGGNTHRN